MSRPRAIHFAPTILPQDISVSSNWHGIYERGRMKNIKICLMVVGLTFVIYQMTPSLY